MPRVLDALNAAAWAMTPEALQQIHDIAARENEITVEALEKIRAHELARSETANQRGSVAILPLEGPMFKKANLFVRISGATSYEIARRDLQVALDNPAITAILLNIDSPGGEVTGADELAKAIFAARSQKRIVAYVGGSAHSAAIWIASAAHEIVMAETATAGSIGVVASLTDTRERDQRSGVRKIEIVSSQSPDKRMDPTTEPGRAKLQAHVDDVAQVFVEAVARYRGVSARTVIEKFGQGGFLIASKAIAVGMADRIGTFESVIDRLNKRPEPARLPTNSVTQLFESGALTASLEDARKEALADVQSRLAAIITSQEGRANPGLAEHLAFKTSLSAEEAKAALAVAALDAASRRPTFQQAQRSISYVEHRAAAGGLTLVSGTVVANAQAVTARSGWKKAVDNANKGMRG